jgi:hypothetical protein
MTQHSVQWRLQAQLLLHYVGILCHNGANNSLNKSDEIHTSKLTMHASGNPINMCDGGAQSPSWTKNQAQHSLCSLGLPAMRALALLPNQSLQCRWAHVIWPLSLETPALASQTALHSLRGRPRSRPWSRFAFCSFAWQGWQRIWVMWLWFVALGF